MYILYVVPRPVPLWLWPLIRGVGGVDGRSGEKGEKGWRGLLGDEGPRGEHGNEQGERGDTGATGAEGERVSKAEYMIEALLACLVILHSTCLATRFIYAHWMQATMTFLSQCIRANHAQGFSPSFPNSHLPDDWW